MRDMFLSYMYVIKRRFVIGSDRISYDTQINVVLYADMLLINLCGIVPNDE